MATVEDVRWLGSSLERSYPVYVRGRLKFRVKQIVYVEKKERGAPRGVSTRTDGREELARRDDKNERGAGTSESQAPARGQDTHAGYFTRVDMNDFQPAGEVKFRIVSRGGTDEK